MYGHSRLGLRSSPSSFHVACRARVSPPCFHAVRGCRGGGAEAEMQTFDTFIVIDFEASCEKDEEGTLTREQKNQLVC